MKRDQAYGIVTSDTVALVVNLSANSQSHDADYFYFEPSESSFADFDGKRVVQPSLRELFLPIAILNLIVGLQSDVSVPQLQKQVSQSYTICQPPDDQTNDLRDEDKAD